jgi:hypothetical protein
MHSDGVITVEGILRSIGFDEAAEGERRAGHARFRFRGLVASGKADGPVQRPRSWCAPWPARHLQGCHIRPGFHSTAQEG